MLTTGSTSITLCACVCVLPRCTGQQGGGAVQGAAPAAPAPVADDMLVTQLESMGFSRNACTRAALAVNNSGAEAAMEWLLTHMEDPDFNDPIPAPAQANAAQPAAAAAAEAGMCVLLTTFMYVYYCRCMYYFMCKQLRMVVALVSLVVLECCCSQLALHLSLVNSTTVSTATSLPF